MLNSVSRIVAKCSMTTEKIILLASSALFVRDLRLGHGPEIGSVKVGKNSTS